MPLRFTPILLFFASAAFAASSEIPLRREFPVNPSVNPCQNFYDYACSKVRDSFQLREDRSRHTFAFSDSDERILEYKKKYFKDLAQAKASSEREQQLKNYYLACMNADGRAVEERKFVDQTFADLQKIQSKDELYKFLQGKIKLDNTGVVIFDVVPNLDRPTENDLYFDTDMMTLPERSYYDKPEVVADLQSIVTSFFKTVKEDNPEERARKIVEFEKQVAKIYPTPQDFRGLFSSRTGITKKELVEKYPHLNLAAFIADVPDRTHIRNLIPGTMELLNKELQEKPLDDLKDIYAYFALSGYMDDAYPEFFNEFFKFNNKHLGGPAVRPGRQERCTRAVMGTFTRELDSILWPRLFPDFPKKKVISLAEKIRKSILSSLKENTWLSPGAKKEAIKKIRTARLQLVAPLNDEEWNFSPRAKYSATDPIKNSKLFLRLKKKKNLAELKKPISPLRWGMGPLTINAYYNPSYNKFVLPVGILQYPFFDGALPDEANLAAMGTVIGHELGHGIDDKGSKYDSNGILRDWMTKEDREEFRRRGSALANQFSQIGHNGELTLGENIGDFVGLTASYKAAFHDKFADAEMKRQFFLQYGRVWCEVERPKHIELRLKTDPHSLGYARVNEQVKQQPGFKDAFGCKDGDPMVLPADKLVHIW